MSIWHLQRKEDGDYDELDCAVVFAPDEQTARTLADGEEAKRRQRASTGAFLDQSLTTCVELLPLNATGVVCADFYEP